jgi:putative transposase
LPVADALTEVLRHGARELLQEAVETEVAEFIARHRELTDARERRRVVRNGYKPERTIQTGIGAVAVKAPRVRDREGEIKFRSSILPAYLRRTRSIEERGTSNAVFLPLGCMSKLRNPILIIM